jgi:hypothetical protein
LLKIGTYFRRNCPTDSSIPMICRVNDNALSSVRVE